MPLAASGVPGRRLFDGFQETHQLRAVCRRQTAQNAVLHRQSQLAAVLQCLDSRWGQAGQQDAAMIGVPGSADQPACLEGLHQDVHRLGGHAELSRQVGGGELALPLQRCQDGVLRCGQAGRGKLGIELQPDGVLSPPELDQEVRLRRNRGFAHRIDFSVLKR